MPLSPLSRFLHKLRRIHLILIGENVTGLMKCGAVSYINSLVRTVARFTWLRPFSTGKPCTEDVTAVHRRGHSYAQGRSQLCTEEFTVVHRRGHSCAQGRSQLCTEEVTAVQRGGHSLHRGGHSCAQKRSQLCTRNVTTKKQRGKR